MKTRNTLAAGICAAIVLHGSAAWSFSVLNDSFDDLFGPEGLMTTTGLTTLGIVIGLYDKYLVNNLAVASYIRQNAAALQEDISLGAGATTVDLATAFGVSEAHLPHFGALLREHRRELLPLTEVDLIDARRAGEFVQIIVSGIEKCPELSKGRPATPIGS